MTVMATTNLPGFRAGDRHGRQELLCGYLEQVILGEAAQQLLDDPHGLPDQAALAELPCWTWLPSPAVRRKGRTRDGAGALLLPARTTYDHGPLGLDEGGLPLGVGPLVLITEPEHRVAWSYTGPGVTGAGTATIHPTHRTVLTLAEIRHDGEVPADIEASLLHRAALTARLSTLAGEGRAARWQLLAELERDVRRCVEQAHNAIVADINNIDADTWTVATKLDAAELDELITRITFGDETVGIDDSHINRVITKLTKPGTLAKVDIMRWLRVNLSRDATAYIRKELGDPHIGTKIRKLARSMPGAGPTEILDAYRLRYPADRAGADRVAAALNPITTSQIHHADAAELVSALTVPDHADGVIDGVDLAARARRAVLRPAPTAPPRFALAHIGATTRPGVPDPFDQAVLVRPRERRWAG